MWLARSKSTDVAAIVLAILAHLGTQTAARGQVGPPTPPAVPPRVDVPPGMPQTPPRDPKALKDFEKELQRLQSEVPKPPIIARLDPNDDEILTLRKHCYFAANRELTARFEAFYAGTQMGTIDSMIDTITKRLVPAELALSDRPADKVVAHQRALTYLKIMELVNETRYQAGRISPQDLEQTRFERLMMQVKHLEAKRSLEAPQAPASKR
jgi:hypothetical protein